MAVFLAAFSKNDQNDKNDQNGHSAFPRNDQNGHTLGAFPKTTKMDTHIGVYVLR